MPRHRFGQEAFHMDHLRSSPSQQHLDPTSRSSSSSQQDHDDLDGDMAAVGSAVGLVGAPGGTGPNGGGAAELSSGQRPHKLDLYSIPVFLLECLILSSLGYAAYFIHFQYKLAPLLSGFYCDDISLRQSFKETKFTHTFIEPDNELTVLVLLLVIPIVIIIFCELVNSMFGSLKFRQIRSLCKCCKLHSITRRTLRFCGAYLLGFLLVMISCDILATSAGKFHPYFAQECPAIYNECFKITPTTIQDSLQPQSTPIKARDSTSMEQMQSQQPQNLPLTSTTTTTTTVAPSSNPQLEAAAAATSGQFIQQFLTNNNFTHPLSQPISSSGSVDTSIVETSGIIRTRREITNADNAQVQQQQIINKNVIERKWIDLTDADLKQLCQISGDRIETRKFDSIAMSWPSFPGAIFAYACFYLACYLSFVGTARPFRLITSVLVMILLLIATIFNGQLVKEHYNHWEDVAGGAALSFVIVLFVLLVYLNKFRDTHYYENQKLYGSASKRQQQLRRSLMMMGFDGAGGGGSQAGYKVGYNNELGQYQLDKIDSGGHHHHLGSTGASAPIGQNLPNGNETDGIAQSANDLAMRYFQIPRANYRGAPRPLSSMNRT